MGSAGGHGSCDSGTGACLCDPGFYGSYCDGCARSLYAWGDDTDGAVTDAAGVPPAVAIDAGEGYGVALHADGTVTGWGLDWFGQVSDAAGVAGAVAIDAGPDHIIALLDDGSVYSWGADFFLEVSEANAARATAT